MSIINPLTTVAITLLTFTEPGDAYVHADPHRDEARSKTGGCDSPATRRTLSDSVTVLCPAITPYGWQDDPAEAR